jgi:signal transduction histidine kinase
MTSLIAKPAAVLIIALFTLDATAQQHATILRSVSVNGCTVPEHVWKAGITIRPEDFVQWHVAVCTAEGDTIEAASYLVELSNEEVTQQRILTAPALEYKGLPEGDYTLRLQAQVEAGKIATPLLVRFRVGHSLGIGHEQHADPSTVDSTASSQSPAFPLRLWIAIALGSSFISVIMAFLLLQHRRRTRLTAQDFDHLRSELENAKATIAALKQFKQEQQRDLDDLRHRLELHRAQAEQTNKHLAEQNRQLRDQVERLRAAKERLEKLQEEKDELLSILIHDIKNPLLVIEQMVQLLRKYDSNSTEMQTILNDLAETASRIVALSQQVSRLLAFERSDGLPLNLDTVNLTEILHSVIQRNAYLARRKEIEILQELPQQLVAECDPQCIEEVFDNILSNAIKYSHPKSVVIVRATAGETSISIEFEDHGVGMSSDDPQRLFERGMQGSSSPTANEPSSGIGLWIVRRLIERHNGTIAVRSTKGEGTIVTITLPAHQGQEQRPLHEKVYEGSSRDYVKGG